MDRNLGTLIVADIHSNLEAFQAVLQDAEGHGGFQEIWVLGDIVGYGSDPGPCIELLRQYGHYSVAGNHDWAAVGKLSLEEFNPIAAEANRWTAQQLSLDQVEFLSNLPIRLEREGFTMVHGSPVDPLWEYILSLSTAWASFQHFQTRYCLVGHSHIPFMCRQLEDRCAFLEFPVGAFVELKNERFIINPGSVGQPRDGDPRASYAIYDSDRDAIVRFRVEYDIAAAQEKIRCHGLPEFLAERLAYGR